ncbi:MAG: sulfotransferase [Planctomycetota bacterium]|nr:MAG: sulfotransferase [Planctomycetota bacterium]
MWVRLGGLETRALHARLDGIAVDRPIYVAGLARSGSTILLEVLAAQQDVAAHRYSDFPGIFTPFWWHEVQRRSPKPSAQPVERAHADGLLITPDSPEAMEEALWMAFFPSAHDPARSQVLDAQASHPSFERFYRDHLRKLLLVRGRSRYASKNNYNLTRLQYLQRLFPEARFVVPIRRPLNHIASLMKQHHLFRCGESAHRRALVHMRRVGHFEFGLDHRPINTGDPEATRQIVDLWRRGEEVRGWARYWAQLHNWLADRIAADASLARSTLVIRFEDLCQDPSATLARLFEHAQLDGDDVVHDFAGRIHAPEYYRPQFTSEERAVIAEETDAVASRFGYDREDADCEWSS